MYDKYSQNIKISSGKYNHERDYWLNKLSGELVIESFPYDYSQPKASSKSEIIKFKVPDKIFKKIFNMSRKAQSMQYIRFYLLVSSICYVNLPGANSSCVAFYTQTKGGRRIFKSSFGFKNSG